MNSNVRLVVTLGLSILCLCSCNKPKSVVNINDTVYVSFKIKDEFDVRLDESSFNEGLDENSYDNPLMFVVGKNEVIHGWDSVIIGCKIDTVYEFDIPYKNAYDDISIYHDIPPQSNLKLTFKILKIE